MTVEKMQLDKDELLELYNYDLELLLELASKYMSENVEICSLVNAKSGKCSQDCKYCAQSSYYRTNIESYPLIDKVQVRAAAEEAKTYNANHFAVVTSGKTIPEPDFDKIIEYIGEINKIKGLSSCASIGILSEEQVKKLSLAGLKRVHHNINTSKSYYPEICTTHTWQERFNTCMAVKKYKMELCCGVILGMGECVEQRVEMAMQLAEIQPDSIPINILMPIPQTPFENYSDKIDEENVLRTLAIFKIANPDSVLRFCGGRMKLSKQAQEKALKTCVEAIMTGSYLTTTGSNPKDDIEMISKLGKKILK